MTDAATLTLTLDPELLESFVAEADAAMRPADDVLRDLVRDFVDRHRSARDAEIDGALREADNPEVKRVSHDEAVARLRQQRAGMNDRARRSVG
ncbi:antitoxin of toxin-antitoxin stability system [Lichenibacterium minor]|uniref:Antitoxin of toxin-antitoxin stability system n=1 Tax=Lichenibacterium minor TaxID=2316528 RepID=A0A4Q2U9D2_9HYPH|nr:antitoxin of toxin-antitoxin stability system [Lichenibacterium minor]RYC33419.1 antitoxin of toxin-antitoxin stability system [Lichenibacterium minor]